MKRYIFIFVILLCLPLSVAHSGLSSYELPEPGMLPDHPLYKLKVLRDKILPIFIYKPDKKLEFDLFMSDKLLKAGIMLFNKKKIELAVTTLSKSENYMTILSTDYRLMLWHRQTIPSWIDNAITLSYEKRQEVYDTIKKQLKPSSALIQLEDIVTISTGNYQTIQNEKNKLHE